MLGGHSSLLHVLAGMKAVTDIQATRYKVNSLLIKDTRKVYDKLKNILNLDKKDNYTPNEIEKLIRQAFRVAEASDIDIHFSAGNVLIYSAVVVYVNVDGTVSLGVDPQSDFDLLREDLVIAFYRGRGGQCGITSDFISYLETGKTKYLTSEFIEV